jgi:RNA polymerase sigma-70 factor (ECF subfamily)
MNGGTTQRSDSELLAAHVAGDRYAFEELFRRHHRQLRRVARTTCRHPEDADDALQDALLAAHRNAAGFRHNCTVASWLHRIVVNACIDGMRRNIARRNRSAVFDARLVPDPAPRVDTAIVVWGALLRLPEDQRAALLAVDMHGYSVAEAARLLDVPEGTVKSRRARARGRLAATLRPLHPESACTSQSR